MPQLLLNEDDLLQVKTLLKKWVPNSLVLAYGSRVKGSAHAGSDLDLVVKNPFNPEQPTLEITELKQNFSESDIPIRIDVMDWAYLPLSYRDEINQVHIIVQKNV